MFNKDFYPTPYEVIDKMMVGEDVTNMTVLEPSAGSGNIVGWLQEHGAREVLACEKEPRLRRMLQCRVIGDDFLSIGNEEVSHIRYIVMNPPFSEAERHLRHAWDIAPSGCVIVSLMPSSVFDNTYSRDRKALKDLVELNGSITYLGRCFRDAERTTDVEVSLVKMHKAGEGENEFKDYFFDQTDLDDHGSGEFGIMPYNAVRDLVDRYKSAVETFDEAMALANKINSLADFSSMLSPEVKTEKHIGNTSSIRFGAMYVGDKKSAEITREVYKKQLQKDAWQFVFQLLDLGHMATNKLREQINQFVEQQSNVPFTMRNIYKMLEVVVATNGQRMETCLCDAFDTICSFSYDNSTAGEGWKTNSNYMVNRRFIIPYLAETNKDFQHSYVKESTGAYTKWHQIEDVEKALCHITGEPFSSKYEDSMRSIFNQSHAEWGKWFDCGKFFRCRAYKKGTVHFEFKDEDVWLQFNATVAKIRGWKSVGNNMKKR